MLQEDWSKKMINDLVNVLLSAICGVTIEELHLKLEQKLRAKNVITRDKKYIEATFSDKNEVSVVLNYFKDHIIPEFSTFYAVADLSKKQQCMLLSDFELYVRDCERFPLENKQQIKKLIMCVNNHNRLIREANLDNRDRLLHSIIDNGFKNVEEILQSISDTLCQNTNFQDDNDELDYLTQQLESTIKIIRVDVKHARKTVSQLLLAEIIAVAVSAISFCLTIKYLTVGFAFIELIFLIPIILLVLVPLLSTNQSLREKEILLTSYTKVLMDLHLEKYKNLINTLFDKTDYVHMRRRSNRS